MRDALGFLTALPVGGNRRAPRPRSLLAFPLVGLLLGAAWALVAFGASRLWGTAPAAAAVIVVDLLLTGALHLDAVADVADGWASRLPPEEAVAVMRDPGIGAVGAAVLGATLMMRWSLIALLAAQHHWGFLVVVPVAGRSAMVAVMTRAPSSPGSLAEPLSQAGWRIAAGVAAIAIAAGILAGNLRGAAAVAAAPLAGEVLARWGRRRFGAVTGDVIGAAGIAAEILALGLLSARW